jgi:hypothetical protein
MNNNKVEAETQLNVGLQEAVTTGQIVVQVTDDSDPPQPIAGAQVLVIDGTIVTGTTKSNGGGEVPEVTLDVSFDGMELFATKDVTVTVAPPDGYTLGEQSTQTVTAIAVATIDVNLVIQPSSPGSRTLQVVPAGPGSGTVSSGPAGIGCGEDCSEVYANGTPVTLTATPETGSVFSGWSGGGCSGTGSCTVTMDQNRTIIANFGLDVHTLQIELSGSGNGTVSSERAGISCGADCSEVYANGTPVTLTATPETGSVFSGWSGGGCSGREPCTVQMDQDRLVQAIFTLHEPPVISNIRQSRPTTNSDSCIRADGSTFAGGRYLIVFDYDDPDGDAINSQGATVQAFGSFDATPFSRFSGDGFTGSIQSDLCSVFGNAASVNVTVTLTDGNGLRSNELTITIPAPVIVIE